MRYRKLISNLLLMLCLQSIIIFYSSQETGLKTYWATMKKIYTVKTRVHVALCAKSADLEPSELIMTVF
jgi:hypothetical protein